MTNRSGDKGRCCHGDAVAMETRLVRLARIFGGSECSSFEMKCLAEITGPLIKYIFTNSSEMELTILTEMKSQLNMNNK